MNAKYQAYEEYKDSGVEMLGALPSIWRTKQVRYLLKDGAEGIKIGPFGSALKLEDMVDSGTRVYGQENVIKKDFTLGKRKISQSKFEEMKVYQAFTDDLLITMMGTSGKCELVPEDADVGIIDSHLLRLRVKESEILPRFFRLLIDECYEIENQIKISGKGSIMHGLNSSIVKSLTLPVPNLPEQRTILNFLDHETAKIDTLIEKQQQLIKLLKEKRQAVISHAVTKGLNPNAPMRDSGVEWLGEVPEHWGSTQIKYGYDITLGKMLQKEAKSSEDKNKLYLKAMNIQPEGLYLDKIGKMWFSPNDMKSLRLQKGDVLISEGGDVGRACIWMAELPECYIQNAINRARPLKERSSRYLLYWMSMLKDSEYIDTLCNKTTIAHYTAEKLESSPLLLPENDEANQIASFLDNETLKIDKLIEKADSLILFINERRTALISAAVTGKIDVRNWQPSHA